MKKLLLAAAAACVLAPGANAAALVKVTVAGIGGFGGTWDTEPNTWAVFLQRPVGVLLNPTDNFSSSQTTLGMNNYLIAGEGFAAGSSMNSSPLYRITLAFEDGAQISGEYLGSTFENGTSATVGNMTYTMNGFGWDRSPTDNVQAHVATSGGDPADYTGQFSYFASMAPGAVPEPGTWALFVVGFGLLGNGMRTRAKRSGMARNALRIA